MPDVFFPDTIEYVKKRARQLRRAFPGLAVGASLEATACALGFADYFHCVAQLRSPHHPSADPDECVPERVGLTRRYQQVRALVDIADLPAADVDLFVRAWNLTSREPPAHLGDFCLPYHASESLLRDSSTDGQPDDELHRVAEGIIRNGDYLQLDLTRLQQVPIYLRGNFSQLSEFEPYHVLDLACPHVLHTRNPDAALAALQEQEPWLYEWHTGYAPTGHQNITLKELLESACQHPQAWFPLSLRFELHDLTKTGHWYRRPNSYHHNHTVIPALRGAHFTRFIAQKGSLKGLQIAWLSPWRLETVRRIADFGWWHSGLRNHKGPAFIQETEVSITFPLYAIPFKHGPMCRTEFLDYVEGDALLLDEEICWEN